MNRLYMIYGIPLNDSDLPIVGFEEWGENQSKGTGNILNKILEEIF